MSRSSQRRAKTVLGKAVVEFKLKISLFMKFKRCNAKLKKCVNSFLCSVRNAYKFRSLIIRDWNKYFTAAIEAVGKELENGKKLAIKE